MAPRNPIEFSRNTLDAEKAAVRLSLKQLVGGLISFAVFLIGSCTYLWNMTDKLSRSNEKTEASALAANEKTAAIAAAAVLKAGEAVQSAKDSAQATDRLIKESASSIQTKMDAILVNVASARNDAWGIHDMKDLMNELKEKNPTIQAPDSGAIYRNNRPNLFRQ